MRKVFLDELPRLNGYEGKRIDWKNSVGYKVKFVYDDIEGEIEIISYIPSSKPKLIIRYKDKVFNDKPISTTSLNEGKLGFYLKRITNEFKIEIGQIFKDEKRDLVIIDREYRDRVDNKGNNKFYKYKCNTCGWAEGWIVESALIKQDVGCSCCAGRTAVLGINTIWDTDRWMCDLGVSEEDAKKYTRGSGDKIDVICPDCGKKNTKQIYSIYNQMSTQCTCGDGFSYPEKFMMNMLNQLSIEFESQYIPNWITDKRYDFYLPNYNMIIETHGSQHYKQTKNFKRTLEEEQENDRIKKEMALNNDIDEYIVIDCRESTVEWIRKSILDSKLNVLFNLSNVDWLECEKHALSNVIKELCEYWNNKEEWETTTTIAGNNPWGIMSRSTINRYLNRGVKLGWCNYSPKGEMKKSIKKCNGMKKKKIEIFKDGVSLGIFESAVELSKKSEERFGIKLLRGNIAAVCTNKSKQYKGFTFKHIK